MDLGINVYNPLIRRNLEICCNFFDAEDAGRVAEKYIDLVFPGGRIVEDDDYTVELFRVVSLGTIYVTKIHIHTQVELMHGYTYTVHNSSFETLYFIR